jgi:hypothetical protein
MDETYREFVEEGEMVYSGRPSRFIAHSGRKRMVLTFELAADPKITQVKIFWNNPELANGAAPVPGQRNPGRDSLKFEIQKASREKDYVVPIENLVEGIYTFEIFTFDSNGNTSIRNEAIGEVFGDVFQNSIVNRPLERAVHYKQFNNPESNLDLEWLGAAKAIVAVEIKYTNTDDVEQTVIETKVTVVANRPKVFLPRTIMPNYKPGTNFQYRTGFLPNIMAADTFWTDYNQVTFVQEDRMIRPGIYKIIARHSGSTLKVRNNATAANGQVEQNVYDNLLSSQWKIQYNAGGNVVIKNVNSSMDMAVAGGATGDNINIQQILPIATATHDEWIVEPVDIDKIYFRLKNQATGKVAGIQSGALTNGQSLQQQSLNVSALHQQFEFEFVQAFN